MGDRVVVGVIDLWEGERGAGGRVVVGILWWVLVLVMGLMAVGGA